MGDDRINHEFGFVILVLSLSAGLLFYFFSGLGQDVFFSPDNLPENICKYENDYLTCGADYVIYDYEGSYNLVANQPYYFHNYYGKSLTFVDDAGYSSEMIYLTDGENYIEFTWWRNRRDYYFNEEDLFY